MTLLNSLDRRRSTAMKDAVGIVNGFNISSYAPPPHAAVIANMTAYITSRLTNPTAAAIDTFMQLRAPHTPLTGQMFLDARDHFNIGNPGLWLMVALCQDDSMFGTLGEGARLHNPGNVGDDDAHHTIDFGTWENGVWAVAKWLAKHRVKV